MNERTGYHGVTATIPARPTTPTIVVAGRAIALTEKDVGRVTGRADASAGPDECWPWVGARNRDGYGQVSIQGRTVIAHRVLYALWVGPIPARMTVDHLCRVRHCVNPAHLEAVTKRENTLRGMGFAAVNARKSHCPRRHPFDDDNTYLDPANRRHCRLCTLAAQRRFRVQRKGQAA